MGADALAQVLLPLKTLFPAAAHPELLVGLDKADDAAVYRIAEDMAIVATTDFFPPVVDDPYAFGVIAAANAMSDVFAMGGEVLFALNLLASPDDLEPEVLAEIIRGGAETVKLAGGVVAGGHSVSDREPKYGLAVVGRVHPERILTKGGAKAGDLLVLTKALGTGLVTTALKRQEVDEADLAAAVRSMSHLNRAAGVAAGAAGARSATDITGYGLAGHALEMAESSGADFVFEAAKLPSLPGVETYAVAEMAPGGTVRNREAFGSKVDLSPGLPAWVNDLVFDPQTSGGLLIAVDPSALDGLLEALADEPFPALVIGRVEVGEGRLRFE
jgi:selenide,water dikinase